MKRSLAAIAATLGLSGLALTSCSKVPEPGPVPLESAFKPVRIVYLSGSAEQQILGKLYQSALIHSGRKTILNAGPPPAPNEHGALAHTRIDVLDTLGADLVIGCTGELLNILDPVTARKLSTSYVAATHATNSGEEKNSGTWRDTVYTAMVNALPGNLMASDPSSAISCTDYDGPPLPENVVAVFRKPMLDRNDRLVLNKVGGTITTNDLVALKKNATTDASIDGIVAAYAANHDL